MENLKMDLHRCSVYEGIRSRTPIVAHLHQILDDIKVGRYKLQIEGLRLALAQQRMQDAKQLKSNLPAIMFAGTSPDRHTADRMATVSGLACFDLDGCDNRIEEFRSRLTEQPWVMALFLSPSGNGLKVVVSVVATDAVGYEALYRRGLLLIKELLGFEADRSCVNRNRLCFYSYDPNLYFNADAVALEGIEVPHEDEQQPKQPSTENGPNGFQKSTPQQLVDAFLVYNVFVKGNRNNFLMKLGRKCARNEFSQLEVAQVIAIAQRRLAGGDVTAYDVESRILSGYNYGSRYQGVTLAHIDSEDPSQFLENEQEKGEKLRSETPVFPENVFQNLPEFMERALSIAGTDRERDIMLLSMLSNLSACLPHVTFNYHKKECRINLFVVINAPAGSGKGIMASASEISTAVHRHYMWANKKKMNDYRREMQEWELARRRAILNKTEFKVDQPEKPKLVYIKMAPNTSKAKLISVLDGNGSLCCVINATEIESLTSANRQDYGQFSELLRLVFENEPVESFFKIDDQKVEVECPQMSICMTGTPGQFLNLIPSAEDGLLSRIMMYTFRSEPVWRSAAPPEEGEIDSRKFIGEIGKEVLDMHHFLLTSPTRVVFTKEQWAMHTKVFRKILNNVKIEGVDDALAVVYRHGQMCMRIAAIFTALRKCGPQWNTSEYKCTDDDLQRAISIIEVMLEHTLLNLASLNERNSKPGTSPTLKKFHKATYILVNMPYKFTFSDFVNFAVKEGVSKSTAIRYIAGFVKVGIIEKTDKHYRKR